MLGRVFFYENLIMETAKKNVLIYRDFYSSKLYERLGNLMIQNNQKKILTNLWGRLLTIEEVKKQLNEMNGEISMEELLEQFERQPAIEVTHSGYCCVRCHNKNLKLFASLPIQETFNLKTERVFCLNCIQMGRVIQGESLYYLKDRQLYLSSPSQSKLTWEGTLSPEQSRASIDLINSLRDSERTHMVHAVTGAGKTEMIFPVIDDVVRHKGRVCVASPRIDVCIELHPRLKQAFQSVDISLLYGGSEDVYGYTPIVVCTTHQLLRFKEAFDLLIVDEVDAFPYVNDASLHYATERAVKKPNGKLVYLTATPDQQLTQQVDSEVMTSTILPARYHRHPLPEPKFNWIGDWRQQIEKRRKRRLFSLLSSFLELKGVKLVFMPNIRLAESLYDWLIKVWPTLRLAVVHSKDPQRKEKVQGLRDGVYDALISTTILERGVTFTHCHVCIVGSESKLYSTSALVQMSGRVGRKPEYPSGELIYAHGGKNLAMIQARTQIKEMNQLAMERGLIDGYTSK